MLWILLSLFLFYVAFKLMRAFPLSHRDLSGEFSAGIVIAGLLILVVFGIKVFLIFVFANIIFFAMRRLD